MLEQRTFVTVPGMLDKRDVAAAIKELRGGRTQKEVAEQAGIDRPTWNQYEKARAMPKRTNFHKILQGLGCTQRELDETIMAAWRKRLDEEHPPETPDSGRVMSTAELEDALGDAEPVDELHRRIRRHTTGLALHLEALLLFLRDVVKD